jgi:hypothetical protein
MFKKILLFTAVVTLHATSYVHAENYEWLKSPEYQSIFVLTDFKECAFMTDKLNETVKRTFSRSNIEATISSSLVFKTKEKDDNSIYELLDDELLDDELIGENKIILHIYGKCIKYSSGFVYQFDIHFGKNNKRYSQAFLYSKPRHSVIGVESIMSIDRIFRKLMENVVNDYWSANQQQNGNEIH